MFKLPLEEAMAKEYFPALQKWKTGCSACPKDAGELACWGKAGKGCANSFVPGSYPPTTAPPVIAPPAPLSCCKWIDPNLIFGTDGCARN